jgi:hypothetical protein
MMKTKTKLEYQFYTETENTDVALMLIREVRDYIVD